MPQQLDTADNILGQQRRRRRTGRRPVKVFTPAPAAVPRAGRVRSTTPEPPAWVQVPLERLDDSGQAIDDEGDRVLNRATKERRK